MKKNTKQLLYSRLKIYFEIKKKMKDYVKDGPLYLASERKHVLTFSLYPYYDATTDYNKNCLRQLRFEKIISNEELENITKLLSSNDYETRELAHRFIDNRVEEKYRLQAFPVNGKIKKVVVKK